MRTSEISEARVAELEARCEFSRLNNGLPEDVFRLLQNGQISVGKACEWLGEYLLTGVQGPIAGMDDAPYDSRLDEKSASEIIAELEAENKRLRGEPTYGAAMNALMEEESKQSLAQLYLEAIGSEKRMRNALVRLRDCDWNISLPDRMDAVRQIAREALEAFPREEAKL